MSIRKIAILGAGNGGCAAAADLKLRGYEISLFSRSERTLAPIVERGGVELIENSEAHFAKPDCVTTDLSQAVDGADLIIVAAPAVAHEYLARNLARYLRDGQRILLNPGHTGGSLHFAHVLREAGSRADVLLCETVTLTYICRMPAPARVEIYRRTAQLRCAAFPGNSAGVVDEVREVFPNVVRAENVLETGFANINAIMHPAGMMGNAGWIEKAGGDFLFYREGITPAVAAWIEAVDGERLEIVSRLGLERLRFIEIFHGAGLTNDEAHSSGSIHRAITESGPNRSIKAPPSLDHRYIKEDVGYGLVPMTEIGGLVSVKTPVMDALITLASRANRTDYRTAGLTLDRMGLGGTDAAGLLDIVQQGFQEKTCG